MNRKSSRFSIVSSLDDTQPTTFSDSSPQGIAISHIRSTLPSVRRSRIAENFIIVWLNLEPNYSSECIDRYNTQLRDIAKSVNLFADINSCIDFITDIVFEEVLLIVSGCCAQQIVSIIDNISQICSIYILHCQDECNIENLRRCRKIKGLFTEIERICEVIQRDVRRWMIDLPSFSILSTDSTPKLDELDSSFMYTQLIKENIIEMKRDPNEVDKFVQYYLNNYPDKGASFDSIEEFRRGYKYHSAISWYARETIAYATINKALRIQDTRTIIKMGFFLRDLHHEIQQAYLDTKPTKKIIVYRGQGMSKMEFDKLVKNKGGLLSFNSFLSTSLKRNVSLMFLGLALQNPDMVDIVFRIEVDPSISSTPYVNFRDCGLQGSNEEEILFCMQTVFRIDRISFIPEGMWEVNLKFTDDNDSQLKTVTDFIRKQVSPLKGWYRIGILMQLMGKYDEALNIFEDFLANSSNDGSEVSIASEYLITNNAIESRISLGNYSNALESLKEMLRKYQHVFPQDHLIFSRISFNIAYAEKLMGHYPEALSNFQKALAIALKYASLIPSYLAIIHYSIGVLHTLMGNYLLALIHQEKSLNIFEKYTPSNHSAIAQVKSSMAVAYQLMGNYQFALLYHEQALKLLKRFLPSNHPNLATIHNQIGVAHYLMGNYPLALKHLEKAFQIYERSLSPDHPHLTAIYANTATIYQSIGNYPLALKYFEKVSEIYKKFLPSDHAELAKIYSNAGLTHQLMGNYPRALIEYEEALRICQKSLPADHADLATTHNNIAMTYESMGNYQLALKHLEKSSEILQRSLPPDHPQFAKIYSNIGSTHQSMGNYPRALIQYEEALRILQKSLPADHSDLATIHNNIGGVHQAMDNYPFALKHIEKGIAISEKCLSANHPNYAGLYNNLATVHTSMNNYAVALIYFEKALAIGERSLPTDHSTLIQLRSNIDWVHQLMNTMH